MTNDRRERMSTLALIDDGRLFVHLTNAGGSGEVWACYPPEGRAPLGEAPGDRNWYTGEWPYPTGPDHIVIERPPRQVVTGWSLGADFAHIEGERYPAALTPAEFDRRAGEFDDPIDPSMRTMYEAVRKPERVEPTIIDGPFTLLDGAPPPRDGLTYVAKLPWALQHHPEYVHLFPGHLIDFREAVKARLEAIDELKVELYLHGSHPSIFVKHPESKVYLFTDQRFPLPIHIDGEDRADARVKWDAKLDEIEQTVRSSAQVCQTCGGTGKPPAAPPARRSRRRAAQ